MFFSPETQRFKDPSRDGYRIRDMTSVRIRDRIRRRIKNIGTSF